MSITTQTPEEIAAIAKEAVVHWDHYSPEERFYWMLRNIEAGQDDLEAHVIAACRWKAGL